MSDLDVSVAIGTYNRVHLLTECIHSVREAIRHLPYEIIVADAGSMDGTRSWLSVQKDIVLLAERGLYGACDAYNKAFRLARAPLVVHLNDDDVCQYNTIITAYDYMNSNPDVGQVAFPYRDDENSGYGTGMALGLPYANKGMTRRWLGDLVGWWGTDYRKYGGDTELSLNIWMLGYKVVMLEGCKVEHRPVDDELRAMDTPNVDSAKFYKKWGRGCLRPPDKPLITKEQGLQYLSSIDESRYNFLAYIKSQ